MKENDLLVLEEMLFLKVIKQCSWKLFLEGN